VILMMAEKGFALEAGEKLVLATALRVDSRLIE